MQEREGILEESEDETKEDETRFGACSLSRRVQHQQRKFCRIQSEHPERRSKSILELLRTGNMEARVTSAIA
jgi:hypothetical protein